MPRTPTIAVDLAKSVFEVACSDRPGRVRARHRFTRAQFARFVATTPAATVVMEACGTGLPSITWTVDGFRTQFRDRLLS